MSAHTPGPWEVLDGNRVSATLPCTDVETSGYVSACIAMTHSSDPRIDKLANARLIAAAPELLEALKEAKLMLEWYYINYPEPVNESDDEAMERIDLVIAKAEGGAP